MSNTEFFFGLDTGPAPEDTRFFLGLDLGQAADFTAVALIEDAGSREEPEYHLRHLHRYPIGTRYPAIVADIKKMIAHPDLVHRTVVIADKTGVGAPVVDLMYEQGIDNLVAITITGGTDVNRESNWDIRVPKRDLASVLMVLFQSGALKMAAGMENVGILVRELENFKVKINTRTGHDSYEAWREGDHDDLVLALAMACWYAEDWRTAPTCGIW